MSEVTLDRVETELTRLWEVETSRPGMVEHPARLRTMTVVAVCPDATLEDSVDHALAHVAAIHNVRTVLLSWHESHGHPDAAARLTAEVNLHRRDGLPVAESIHLHVRGGARSWIPDALAQVVPFDLPVHLWWVSNFPHDDDLFDRLAAQADRVILDTSERKVSELLVLARLLAAGEGSRQAALRRAKLRIVDFCWLRLRTWQELTARFFDDPGCRDDLRTLQRIVVSYLPVAAHHASLSPSPSPSASQAQAPGPAPSTQAMLFVSWLAARLQWRPLGWESGPRPRALFEGPSGRIEVEFVPTPQRAVRPGAIVAVELAGASKDGPTSFHLERSPEDPLVVCWSGEHPTVPIPRQCVRIRRPTDESLLARTLELTGGDDLFEASLRHCADLVHHLTVATVAPTEEAPR